MSIVHVQSLRLFICGFLLLISVLPSAFLSLPLFYYTFKGPIRENMLRKGRVRHTGCTYGVFSHLSPYDVVTERVHTVDSARIPQIIEWRPISLDLEGFKSLRALI